MVYEWAGYRLAGISVYQRNAWQSRDGCGAQAEDGVARLIGVDAAVDSSGVRNASVPLWARFRILEIKWIAAWRMACIVQAA
jgi:hypothetical protein